MPRKLKLFDSPEDLLPSGMRTEFKELIERLSPYYPEEYNEDDDDNVSWSFNDLKWGKLNGEPAFCFPKYCVSLENKIIDKKEIKKFTPEEQQELPFYIKEKKVVVKVENGLYFDGDRFVNIDEELEELNMGEKYFEIDGAKYKYVARDSFNLELKPETSDRKSFYIPFYELEIYSAASPDCPSVKVGKLNQLVAVMKDDHYYTYNADGKNGTKRVEKESQEAKFKETLD